MIRNIHRLTAKAYKFIDGSIPSAPVRQIRASMMQAQQISSSSSSGRQFSFETNRHTGRIFLPAISLIAGILLANSQESDCRAEMHKNEILQKNVTEQEKANNADFDFLVKYDPPPLKEKKQNKVRNSNSFETRGFNLKALEKLAKLCKELTPSTPKGKDPKEFMREYWTLRRLSGLVGNADEKNRAKIGTLTGLDQASFIDYLEAHYTDNTRKHPDLDMSYKENVGEATVFLSFRYTDSFLDLVESLQNLSKDNSVEFDKYQTFYYFDVLVNDQWNQHKGSYEETFNKWTTKFEKEIKGIKHVVCFMSDFSGSRAKTSPWIMLELSYAEKVTLCIGQDVNFDLTKAYQSKFNFEDSIEKDIEKEKNEAEKEKLKKNYEGICKILNGKIPQFNSKVAANMCEALEVYKKTWERKTKKKLSGADLAVLESNLGNYEKAIEYHEEVHIDNEYSYEEDDVRLLKSVNMKGMLLQKKEDFRNAKVMQERVIRQLEIKLKQVLELTADSKLDFLITAYSEVNKDRIWRSLDDETKDLLFYYLCSLNNYAITLYEEHLYNEARPLCEKALKICEGRFEPKPALELQILLGLILKELGLRKEAKEHSDKLREKYSQIVLESIFKERHNDHANLLHHIATVLDWLGEFDVASAKYKEALKRRELNSDLVMSRPTTEKKESELFEKICIHRLDLMNYRDKSLHALFKSLGELKTNLKDLYDEQCHIRGANHPCTKSTLYDYTNVSILWYFMYVPASKYELTKPQVLALLSLPIVMSTPAFKQMIEQTFKEVLKN